MNPSNSSMRTPSVNTVRRIATQNMAAVYAQLDAAAQAARFGQRTVQTAAAQTDAQASSNQQLQQAVDNMPPASVTTTDSQATQPPASWLKALLHQEQSGVSPLNQAIINGNTELAQMLLSQGASASAQISPVINNSEPDIEALFHQDVFADQGNTNKTIVNLALVNSNIAPKGNLQYLGANAVTLAILCNVHPAFFASLCVQAKKRDNYILDRVDGAGRTPLCVAISDKNMNLLRVLLNAGASINGHYQNQHRPLITAAQCSNNDALIVLQKTAIKAEVPADSKGVLEICYANKNFSVFEAYQAVSPAKKREVFQFLCKQARQVLRNGTENNLLDFLECCKPVLSDKRLFKLSLIAAKIPDAKTKLMIIIMMMEKAPSAKQCLALCLAAAESGDEEIFGYVKSLNQNFSSAKPKDLHAYEQQQAQLSGQLARALKTKNKLWMKELLSQGAVFDPLLPVFKKYPLISQLADLGEEELLLANLPSFDQWEQQMHTAYLDYFIHMPPLDFMKVSSADGLHKLLSISMNFVVRLTPTVKFELLIHAANLGSLESIELLLAAGADLNPIHIIDGFDYEGMFNTPIKVAIRNKDQAMVEFLLEHGATPSMNDADQGAFFFPKSLGDNLRAAALAAKNN